MELLSNYSTDGEHLISLMPQQSKTLIYACGIVEMTVFPSKYAMEMSARITRIGCFLIKRYQPDLIKRGMAVEDSSSPALSSMSWDNVIQGDAELKPGWKELLGEGHGRCKTSPGGLKCRQSKN
ncbi:hypothetical protein HAX54_010794 [Datura stramonium]|uniref:Lipoxygenase domain-containing protein n=1 Tax=Datura stramonium TaxID=4076 RepID=A0ABS8RJ01_DATST|nr:hypothetical protein [Datura stramonium]